MAHRPAAALIGWNHHLEAIGLEDGHGGLVHPWIKATLDATEHQSHPSPLCALRRIHPREAIGKPLRWQRRQKRFHRFQLWAQKL